MTMVLPMKKQNPETARGAHAATSTLTAARVPREVTRYIPDAIQMMLWGRAAGRCEFAGCNKPLWKSSITQEQLNISQKAHIYAFSSGGPRGNRDIHRSRLNNIQNLLLVCHECHQKMDGRHNEERYTPAILQRMKAEHEWRIELVAGIAPEKQSHVLLYGANVGNHSSPLNYGEAALALFPERYPASDAPIELNTVNSAFLDRDAQFWAIEAESLIRKFNRCVAERLAVGEIKHLSVFSLAPQPLLVLLGSLLGDIVPSDVYQRHREPPTWEWPAASLAPELEVRRPVSTSGPPALVLSLSATVSPDRITAVLGPEASIWTVAVQLPNNDFTKSREQLSHVRSLLRVLFDQIKAAHGETAVLHIFPAVSVSVAVELGRVRMPKADMRWQIYDQVTDGGFVSALTIPYGSMR